MDRFACVSRKRFIQFGSAKGSWQYLKTRFNLLFFLLRFFIFLGGGGMVGESGDGGLWGVGGGRRGE